MPRRRMTAEEAWRILWGKCAGKGTLVEDPIKVLMASGCGKETAIKLIRKLSMTGVSGPAALLPHTRTSSWASIYAVTMEKEPPPEKEAPQTPLSKKTPRHEGDPVPETPGGNALRYRTPVSRVVVLLDRDNIMISLRELNLPFPFEEILKFAARHGGLEAQFVFCPIFKGAPPEGDDEKLKAWKQRWKEWREELVLFRRHGYRVHMAQSVKDDGGDRVDEALEDMGRLLIKNPDVGTLVILSEDRDFSDLYAFAVGNGKRALQFRVDRKKRVLLSTDYGEQIPIRSGDSGMKALTTRPRTAWQAIRNK